MVDNYVSEGNRPHKLPRKGKLRWCFLPLEMLPRRSPPCVWPDGSHTRKEKHHYLLRQAAFVRTDARSLFLQMVYWIFRLWHWRVVPLESYNALWQRIIVFFGLRFIRKQNNHLCCSHFLLLPVFVPQGSVLCVDESRASSCALWTIYHYCHVGQGLARAVINIFV